jgi:hypothetical protein
MSRINDAKELMAEFPEQTKDYTWKEVADMWEDFSDMYAAGWLIPCEFDVNSVFGEHGK